MLSGKGGGFGVKMKLNIHVHLHIDNEVVCILQQLLEKGIVIMESPEVVAFRVRVEAALANLGADLQRLIDKIAAGSTGLSAEDKLALEEFATKIETLATVVPEE